MSPRPEERDEVLAALATVPELQSVPANDWHIVPLAGLTNRTYRIALKDGSRDYVLRLAGTGTGEYVTRENEAHNAAAAAALGLAPELVHADLRSGMMITRFVADARPLAAPDLIRPDVIRRIAVHLRKLHRSGAVFRGAAEPFAVIDRYLALARDDRLIDLRARAESIRVELATLAEPSAPCHIDPVPENFLALSGDELLLVDWEFSAMADPMWDIASIAVEGDLDAAARQVLLQVYGGRSDEQQRRKLELFSHAIHLVAASWGRAAAALGNGSADLNRLTNRHIEVLLRTGL